jgi:hypothetical protein
VPPFLLIYTKFGRCGSIGSQRLQHGRSPGLNMSDRGWMIGWLSDSMHPPSRARWEWTKAPRARRVQRKHRSCLDSSARLVAIRRTREATNLARGEEVMRRRDHASARRAFLLVDPWYLCSFTDQRSGHGRSNSITQGSREHGEAGACPAVWDISRSWRSAT